MIDKMVRQYIDTAFWATEDCVSKETIDNAQADCQLFLDKVRELLPPHIDYEQLGHDFWLTRNHHGTGFWDRPEIYGGQVIADQLTAIAHIFGECY